MKSLYQQWFFPWLCDRAANHPAIHKLRTEVLAQVSGNVLEIGVGSGLNIHCYRTKQIKHLSVIDANPAMLKKATKRLQAFAKPFEIHQANIMNLPLTCQTMDAVVSTLTLCSVDDIDKTLAEIRRVLHPNGTFYLLEHGKSPEENIARWQKRLTPIQKCIADGCHLNRDIKMSLQKAGFDTRHLKQQYAVGLPRVFAYFTFGSARL